MQGKMRGMGLRAAMAGEAKRQPVKDTKGHQGNLRGQFGVTAFYCAPAGDVLTADDSGPPSVIKTKIENRRARIGQFSRYEHFAPSLGRRHPPEFVKLDKSWRVLLTRRRGTLFNNH